MPRPCPTQPPLREHPTKDFPNLDFHLLVCSNVEEGQNPNLALHFRERDGHGYVRMQAKKGMELEEFNSQKK